MVHGGLLSSGLMPLTLPSMKPNLERVWAAFVEVHGEDDWHHFVEAGASVEERLARFDWLMARHIVEETSWEINK